jgi:Tol biopolymer transport system component
LGTLAFFAAMFVPLKPGPAQQPAPATANRDGFRAITLQTRESSLAKAPEDLVATLLAAVSADGRRVAYRSTMDDKATVFVNGQAGNAFDSIQQGPVISHGEATRVAFVAKRADRTFVIVDGVETGPYHVVVDDSLVISPDGKRIAYAVGRGDQQIAVVGDVENPQSAHTRYEQAYDAISPEGFVYSPDGRSVAFAARQDKGWVVVLDGKHSGYYDWVGTVGFHPDGRSLVYVARQTAGCSVIMKSAETTRSLGGPYEDVGDVVFSPSGRQTAYWAKHNNHWRVVTVEADGSLTATRNAYTGYGEGTLVFSGDGTRLAGVGVRQQKAVVFVNSTEYGPYETILEGTPVFSPNGQRLAYGASRQGVWRVVVDGKEGKAAYGLIKEHSLQFTPDSEHVVYVASYADTGRSMAIAVDGELSNDYLFPLASRLAFDGPKSFHTVAVIGNLKPGGDGENWRLENGQFVRVDAEILSQ